MFPVDLLHLPPEEINVNPFFILRYGAESLVKTSILENAECEVVGRANLTRSDFACYRALCCSAQARGEVLLGDR